MTNPIHLPLNVRPQVLRLPVPHALRAALPSSDRAEAALASVLSGGPVPQVDVTHLAQQLTATAGHAVLGAPAHWTDAQLRWTYVVLLRQLGRLNGRYGKLFDVVDRGLDHKNSNAPISKTKAATGMHTDSSDAKYNPDLVSLLCLQPGASGGQSLLAHAEGLLERLRQQRPDLEPFAREAFPRDVVTPGLAQDTSAIAANAIPVFADDEHGMVFRYMRYWTERAMAKLGRAVPSELTELFDFIDADMADNALRFSLKRGDMLIANNRTVVHGRVAFENLPGAAPRCLVRAWVDGFHDSRAESLPLRA